MTHQPPVSHAYRRQQLAAALPANLDALLVSGPENVRYLSGFTGSNGAVLVERSGPATLATDARYLIQAAEQAPDLTCLPARGVCAELLAQASSAGVKTIGFEAQHITVSLHSALTGMFGGVLVPTNGLVEALRSVKDAAELEALATACRITDLAFTEVVLAARPGDTERDLAFALTTAMRRHGAEADSFEAIVAFGPNSAIPHHEPSERPLARGDLLKTDFGARYAGYHADLTRTVVVGPAADWQRELHAAVAEVQAAGRAAAVPGAVPAELDATARAGIEAAGHLMGHGLGHGVGLQIHEDPFLTPGSAAGPLQPGMVVTIEPGGYVEGHGGVRIEDTVLINEVGAVPLTDVSRELLEI